MNQVELFFTQGLFLYIILSGANEPQMAQLISKHKKTVYYLIQSKQTSGELWRTAVHSPSYVTR